MDLQQRIVEAIAEELQRQSSNRDRNLRITRRPPEIVINGTVDLENVAMVVARAPAGEP